MSLETNYEDVPDFVYVDESDGSIGTVTSNKSNKRKSVIKQRNLFSYIKAFKILFFCQRKDRDARRKVHRSMRTQSLDIV